MAVSQKLATAFVEVTARTDPFNASMKSMLGSINSMAGAMGAAMSAVAGAAIGVGAVAVSQFATYEAGLNEVFTLIPGASAEMKKQMSRDVQELAVEMGVLPEQVIPALYQALSAGVPQENVFEFMRTAQKGAKGGVTDLETSVDALSSVMNAYGADVMSAEKASDIIFTTVKEGKTTFGELANSLFNVAPAAASLGIDFETVGASIAAMTSMGVPTRVATTYMRSALNELSKDGMKAADTFKEISGQSFPDFIKNGGTLAEALQMMKVHAEANGKSIKDLFGAVEGGQAALMLAGPAAEKFASSLQEMQGAAGATEGAYAQMAQGIKYQWEKIAAATKVATVQLGEQLAMIIGPWLEAVVASLGDAIKWWLALDDEMKANLTRIGMITTAVYGLIGSVLLLRRVTGGFFKMFKLMMVGTGVGAIVIALGAAIVAVIELGRWLYNTSAVQDAITNSMGNWLIAWENIKLAALGAWDIINRGAATAIKFIAELIGIDVADWGSSLTEFVGNAIQKMSEWAVDISEWMRVITDNWETTWDLMVTQLQLKLVQMTGLLVHWAKNLKTVLKSAVEASAEATAAGVAWVGQSVMDGVQRAGIEWLRAHGHISEEHADIMARKLDLDQQLRARDTTGPQATIYDNFLEALTRNYTEDPEGSGLERPISPEEQTLINERDRLLKELEDAKGDLEDERPTMVGPTIAGGAFPNMSMAALGASLGTGIGGGLASAIMGAGSMKAEGVVGFESARDPAALASSMAGMMVGGPLAGVMAGVASKVARDPSMFGGDEEGGAGGQKEVKAGFASFAEVNRQMQMQLLKDDSAAGQRAQMIQIGQNSAAAQKRTADNTDILVKKGGVGDGGGMGP